MSQVVFLKCPYCWHEHPVLIGSFGFYPDGKVKCVECLKTFDGFDNAIETMIIKIVNN